MNKLKTSTKVLLALTAAALILGTVLLLTIPQPWVDSIKETHSFMMDGSFLQGFDRGERFHSYGNSFHGFDGLLFIGLIVFFIFGLYKLITLIQGKLRNHHTIGESRGAIILKERFASGEIDENKYKEMMAVVKA
ncbi:MAG: hypothetical protein PF518_16745 [Spirochaetaceae bacterium]|jgi:uncharacterized membrane protein|nr:hypothetical protein [Spirochaetaceae bacterium]